MACLHYVHIYRCLPEPGTMYKYVHMEQGTRKIMYINIYVQHRLGWTVTSPNIFLGEPSLYTIFTGNIVEQVVPLNNF